MVFAIYDLVEVPDLAILTPTINDSILLLKVINALPFLNCVLYIHYLIRFKKDQAKIKA